MAEDPLDRLVSDARERPLVYASVAVAGLAGVAAALALGSRAAREPESGVATLLRTARTALEEAGARTSESAGEAAERARDLAGDARDAATRRVERAAGHGADGRADQGADQGADRGAGRGTDRDDGPRDAEPSGGIGASTAAVFLGTLLSKAFTGWMRLQAEERARAQGAALAGGTGPEDAATRGVPDANGGPAFDLRAHLTELNVGELRALASEHEIEGRSSMNKDELVGALCGEA